MIGGQAMKSVDPTNYGIQPAPYAIIKCASEQAERQHVFHAAILLPNVPQLERLREDKWRCRRTEVTTGLDLLYQCCLCGQIRRWGFLMLDPDSDRLGPNGVMLLRQRGRPSKSTLAKYLS
jgi:hypothetical protein